MRILPVAIMTIAVAVAGCGQKEESKTITSKDGSVTVNTSGDGSNATYTVTDNKGGGGQMTMGAGAATAAVNYPAYAPLYPGAKVMTTIVANANKGGMVVFHSDASQDQIIAFYQNAAKGAGLNDLLNMKQGDALSYSATNEKTKQGVTVVAAKTDQGTQVQLTWNND